MDNWDRIKGRFRQPYDDAAYVAERIKQEYKRRIKDYTNQSEKYGKWLNLDQSGGGRNDDMDAFRHAYTSAKVIKEYGQAVATAGGVFHEIKGQVQDVIYAKEPNGNDPYSQPLPEAIMDEHNNSVGRELGERARQEGWSDRKLAEEIKRAMDEGKLIRNPENGLNVPGYTASESDAPLAQPQASILDYFGKVEVRVIGKSGAINGAESDAPLAQPQASILDYFGKVEVRVVGKSGAINGARASGVPGGLSELEAFRSGNGVVEVRTYSRNGANVRSHTRNKPDDDEANNLSYRRKM